MTATWYETHTYPTCSMTHEPDAASKSFSKTHLLSTVCQNVPPLVPRPNVPPSVEHRPQAAQANGRTEVRLYCRAKYLKTSYIGSTAITIQIQCVMFSRTPFGWFATSCSCSYWATDCCTKIFTPNAGSTRRNVAFPIVACIAWMCFLKFHQLPSNTDNTIGGLKTLRNDRSTMRFQDYQPLAGMQCTRLGSTSLTSQQHVLVWPWLLLVLRLVARWALLKSPPALPSIDAI